MAIDWDQIGREKFDRIVGALAHRQFPTPATVEVINGRGGDGGRDIVIRQGRRLRIAQLKYFPGGFSSTQGKRRRQIRDSWLSIRGGHTVKGKVQPEWPDGKPYEWIFVYPDNLTDSERRYLTDLIGDTRVRLTVWDRAWLDSHLADYPALHDSFHMDDIVHSRIRDHREEETHLLGGLTDLHKRHIRLKQLTDAIDSDWTYDHSDAGDVTTYTLRPQHSHAVATSPIGLTLNGAFGPDQEELKKAFLEMLDFGTPGSVVLPEGVVKDFALTGPPALAETVPGGEVTITSLGSPEARGKRIRFTFRDAHGKQHATHEGVVDHVGAGVQGGSVLAIFHSVMEVTMTIGRTTMVGGLSYRMRTRGASVSDAIKALKFHNALYTVGELDILLEGEPAGSIKITSQDTDDLSDFAAILDDLDVIERNTDCYFTLPDTLERYDRVLIRAVRLLLDGNCVNMPGLNTLSATLNGNDDAGLRQMLARPSLMFKAEITEMVIDIVGTSVPLGNVVLWHTSVTPNDAEGLLAAIDAGTEQGLDLVLKADTGLFRAYREDAMTDPHLPLIVTPWGIAGITEPADTAVELEAGDE